MKDEKIQSGAEEQAPKKRVVRKKTVTSAKKNDTKTQEQSVEISKKDSTEEISKKNAKSVSVPVAPVQEQLAQDQPKKKAKIIDKSAVVDVKKEIIHHQASSNVPLHDKNEKKESGVLLPSAQITQPVQMVEQQSSNQQQKNNNKQDYRNRRNHHQNRGQYQQHQQRYQNQSDQPPKIYTREQLEEMSSQELNVHARRWGVIGASLLLHRQLIEKILEMQQNPDREIAVEGVLEKLPDGFGFLRSNQFDYVSSPDDVYVSPAQIRRFELRTGDTVSGTIRKPRENEKYFALLKVDRVNFDDPLKLKERPNFDRLSPMHPSNKFTLEYDPTFISTRLMDIFTPIGKGQRGLIVAPPKAGKTVLLKEIAQSLIANHPDVYLMVLLIDERPEEVADMKRCVKGAHAEVISSTFDEAAERHVQVAEIVLEKAKRLVESGKDVVILLDAITRLARAYNTTAPASGKILTGGIDANALQRPKRFFGAARAMEEGGSLTIIGTALIETGSRMDEVIYEEFKGTGNMEMHMSRKLANRRIYPSYDLLSSGTRRDDLLFTEEEQKRSWVLQKFLANMNTIEGMEFMIDKMKKFKSNEEFFESMDTNKKNGSNSVK